jgi:drug/metabolite transporter (DMT)-like permease
VATQRGSGLHATRLGVLAVVTPVVGWSFANTIAKIIHAPALTFVFWRLWLGVGAMLLVLLVMRRRLSWPIVRAAWPGGVLFGLNLVFFFSAIKQTKVVDVLVIGALQPALTLLVAGRLFGERIRPVEAVCIGVSVAGVVLLVVGSSGTPAWSLRGDLLAVASLLVWTTYFLLSKRVRERVATVEYMTTVTLVAAVMVTPYALASGQRITSLRATDWLWLALFVVGAQGGHLMLAWAHPQVDVTLSSLLILGEPPFSAVAALVVLGESLTVLEIVGGLVAIAAVGVVARRATVAAQPIDAAEGLSP